MAFPLRTWFRWTTVPGLTFTERLALFFPTRANMLWYLKRLDLRMAAAENKCDDIHGKIGVFQAHLFLQKETPDY
jgi:hypothetical protein